VVAKDRNIWFNPKTKRARSFRKRHDLASRSLKKGLRQRGENCACEVSLKRRPSVYRSGKTSSWDRSATDIVFFFKGRVVWIWELKMGPSLPRHWKQLTESLNPKP
jgi:hypothetical protein